MLPMVAPLNAFPFCSPQGPLQAHCAKSGKPPTLFSHLRLQVNLRQRYKNKRYRFLDTFLLRDLAEREGFEPPEPRSSTVFKTAAIDHSATSPRDKSITSFLIYQTKNENIFHFFTATTLIILKLNNIRMQHFFRLFKAFSLYSAKIPKLTPLNLLSEGLQMRPYHNNLAFCA